MTKYQYYPDQVQDKGGPEATGNIYKDRQENYNGTDVKPVFYQQIIELHKKFKWIAKIRGLFQIPDFRLWIARKLYFCGPECFWLEDEAFPWSRSSMDRIEVS